MEFLKHTLPNGLEVVAECNPHAWSTALGFFVNTGARDESDDLLGVSHFLEHMAFKGTPSQTEDDVDRRFDELGAHHNAFTSEEHTVYHAAVLPECQDRAVELLADRLRPAIRDDDFTTEKQVILEEIRMYEDQPPFGAEDKCRAAFFGEHPLGHKILGTHESVTALSADAMRAYHRGRYAAGNVALVAAGPGPSQTGGGDALRVPGDREEVGRAAVRGGHGRGAERLRPPAVRREAAGHGARRRHRQPAVLGTC